MLTFMYILFLSFIAWKLKKSSNICLSWFCFCLLADLNFAREGMKGMGVEGGTILGLFEDNFETNFVFQPKINFLEMAHTNLFYSIRIKPFQPVFWIKITKTQVDGHSTLFNFRKMYWKLYFSKCIYILCVYTSYILNIYVEGHTA